MSDCLHSLAVGGRRAVGREGGRKEEAGKAEVGGSQGCHFMSGFEVNKIEIGPKWLQSEVPGPRGRRCLPVHSSARQRRSITQSSQDGLNPSPALIVFPPPPALCTVDTQHPRPSTGPWESRCYRSQPGSRVGMLY